MRQALPDPARGWRRLFLAAALLAAGGCSVAPPPAATPALPLPAAWSVPGAAPAAADPRWWRRFNDPVLEMLVLRSLAANASLEQAQGALRQARALRDAAAARLSSTVSGSLSAGRSTSGQAGASHVYDAGFDASWEPDVFGAGSSALQAGTADARASDAALAHAGLSVAAEVAAGYIELRGALARLQLARDHAASQLATMRLVAWRRQAGLLTSLEHAQAVAASEQGAAQLAQLASGVAQLRHALAVLCGEAPRALDAELGESTLVPDSGAEPALGVPADLLRQRPDVRAAEHQVSAALARVGEARAARYPAFRLSGSIGVHGLNLGTLGGGGALISALLGSVAGPLFDAGATKAHGKAQQAALDQARAAYRRSVLNALRDVEDALVAVAGGRARLRHLGNAAAAAEEAATIAYRRFGSGSADYQTVLETQRTLYASRDAAVSAAARLGVDQVRLFKALGGGWRDPAGDGQ